MVGQGFKTAMRVLDKGRLTMGACALGASQTLLDMCIEHVRRLERSKRRSAGRRAVRFLLADMATELYAARCMLYHLAISRDEKKT